jgi:general secretion pathway protein D
MYQRDWAGAQKHLAEAALYAGDQPDLLYDLSIASYQNHDPKTAAAALAGLRSQQGQSAKDPNVLRASAIVAAALNQQNEANNFLDQLRIVSHNPSEIRYVEDRVRSWSDAYQGGLMTTQFPGGGTFSPSTDGFINQQPNYPQQPLYPQQPSYGIPGSSSFSNGGQGRNEFVEKKMAVVDVVIISTEEDNTQAMGVNLLDGLKIQFGSPSNLTPAYSNTKNRNSQSMIDNLNPLNNTNTYAPGSVITRQINIPAVSYSLNIANANSRRNEVLARPTLVALGNQTSNFFSGVDVNAAAVSNGQGSAVQIQKEVGVKLAVTPEFLPNNQIKLNIAAERTFLANPNSSVVFDFRLDTTKTMVNANVVMKFGETLILSGLSERDQSRDKDGVPLLQDIPLIQYFFSRNVERDYYKSVLILLTPRKAQYTNRAEEDMAADSINASPTDLALSEFEAKYRPWFKPIPNIGEITHSLENSALYREFRTGDMAASWQTSLSRSDRLKAAIDFLFY